MGRGGGGRDPGRIATVEDGLSVAFGKQRMVPIGRTTALRLLESYVKGVRPFLVREPAEQALFLDDRGRRFPYYTLRRLVAECARRAGIPVPVTPHTFCRSCTTALLLAGAGPYQVKELLGHESLDTINRYACLVIHDLKQEHRRCHPREKDDSPDADRQAPQ